MPACTSIRCAAAAGRGRCGAEAMAPEPAPLTDATLPAFVAHTELPVLVDFWADWCGPCKMMATHTPVSSGESAAEATNPAVALPSGTVVIDVRSVGEFDSGHIEGAIGLPLGHIQHDLTRLVPDKGTPLLLSCRSGARSARACEIATQLGCRAGRNGGAVGSLALPLGRGVVRT